MALAPSYYDKRPARQSGKVYKIGGAASTASKPRDESANPAGDPRDSLRSSRGLAALGVAWRPKSTTIATLGRAHQSPIIHRFAGCQVRHVACAAGMM